ncbi:MAG TPA: 30S ribosome-binding factor RbfA [Bacteroidales bacterium]|nr:30S ribosome-binding factor RbfA [Bacteroidales bacterium]
METTRQQKIARLLQKDLGDIFLRYAHKFKGVLISVSEVRISSDLSVAHVYLSIFPSRLQGDVMKQIEEDRRQIRGEMGNLERHQLRIIPELSFHVDETIDKMSHIDDLLKQ